MKYQVTFFDKEGHHKPVAAIIEASSRTEIFGGSWKKAAVKICQKRGWTHKDMTNYGYTTFKCRLADQGQ